MQDIGHIYSFFTLFVNFSLLFNGAEESDGSMQWFHFFDGIFLGQWYPEGFHAKIMVLKRFTPSQTLPKRANFMTAVDLRDLLKFLFQPRWWLFFVEA